MAGLSLALVHSTTMLKSVWASDFWKPLVHTNMSKNFENIVEADDVSDYKSDFDSEEEETNEILTKFQNIERDK